MPAKNDFQINGDFNMNQKWRKTICVILSILLCVSLCACVQDNFDEQSITLHTPEDIQSLDPQLASTKAELIAVANCFEGLMVLDADGNVTTGAAKNYQKDGMTYTFTLRDDMTWSDETTLVTAQDFVFGLTRALLPQTQAPMASALFCIENAQQVYDGELSADQLGVRAVDDMTLTVTLSTDRPDFLEILTYPVAMPCNSAFFDSTNGRYGLDDDSLLTNGPFDLRVWNTEDDYLSLSRSGTYNGPNPAVPASVLLGFDREEKDINTNLQIGNVDIGYTDNTYTYTLTDAGFTCQSFYNTTYYLYLSDQLGGENTGLYRALFYDIDSSLITANLPSYLKSATGFISSDAAALGENYREAAGALDLPDYDLQKALDIVENTENAANAFAGITLYYPDGNEDYKTIANILAQKWQSDLNAYINTAADSVSNIQANIESGECVLAILPVSSSDNRANNQLLQFQSYQISGFEAAAISASDSTGDQYIQTLKETEQLLLDTEQFYPLFDEPVSCFVSAKTARVVLSNAGNYMLLKYVEKSEK